MKVSVVIPAYNEEKYIEKTLRAVLAQNYPDFEVIVVDNGSTDGTRRVVESIKDSRIQLVEEPEQGLPFARERGRLVARGKILAQLDADCVPGPTWISRGVRVLMKKENRVSASGPYIYFDSGFFIRNSMFVLQTISQGGLSFFAQLFGFGGFLLGGNAFIKKEILDSVGGYDTKIHFYGEDTETARRLSKKGRTHYSLSLTCPSSGRRFREIGFFKMCYLYCKNVLLLFLNKSVLEKERPDSEAYR